ncbi:WD40 repeat domain-containing protein [Coleofasciculus sp. FACHB-64]|uniref:WD40 repeat domain-containing protein n=1 Tax=Cyanophyceae TaxID=3028117 RepID=UPI0016835505|nr:WD40 repeat domain-containing protein [Coleofasciculus sp. FACHB-64]MBD2044150.1 WD40 repeat domain-containing protein [Coleofasciculus sp. FACHB-64]
MINSISPDIRSYPLQEHQDAVNSVSFSPDGKTIASASLDQTVKLWRVEGGTPQTLSGHTKGVWRVRYSPSEGNMIASGSIDHTVRLWKADNGEFLRPLIGHTDVVYDLSFSPDSKRIATASWDGTIKIWDTATGKELKTLENLGEQDKINSLDFAGTGQTLASGGYKDGSVKLWDLNTGTSTIIGQHNKQVNCVRFSPSGQFLASSSDDGTIKLWKHGQPLTSIKAHEKFIYGLAFSPDEEMLASVSTDGFIKLWKIDGTQLKTLVAHRGEVYDVSFSPDNEERTVLASASEDTTIRLWKILLDEKFDGYSESVEPQEAYQQAINSANLRLSINPKRDNISYQVDLQNVFDDDGANFQISEARAVVRGINTVIMRRPCANCRRRCSPRECQANLEKCCP